MNKEFNKKYLLLLIPFVILIMVSILNNTAFLHNGKSKITATSKTFSGQYYENVESQLKESGFTNIKFVKIDDLVFGFINKDGEVEDVSVGGKIDYSADSWFSSDVEIIIRYHTFPEKTTEDSSTIHNKSDYDILSETNTDLIFIMSKIEEMGYTAKYIMYTKDNVECDVTEQILAFDKKDLEGYEVSRFRDFDEKSKSITVVLKSIYTIQIERDTTTEEDIESSELEEIYAWQKMQEYGSSKYPYGFKLHYLTGVLAHKQYDDGTWFLKAYCTVTNEYGVEAEYNCEANVSGTNDNPKVSNFHVY